MEEYLAGPSSGAPSAPVEEGWAWPPVVLSLLAVKLLLFLTGLLSVILLPPMFNWGSVMANFHWPPGQGSFWYNMLKTWDANQYLYLSEVGYQPGQMADAMYPLWPLLIRVGRFLFRDSLLSAFLLSNLFSLAALAVYHRLVSKSQGRQVADLALILCLAFPGALYYCLAYSESLFLLLTVCFYAALRDRRYITASMLGLLCPLTKAIGIFVSLPLAWSIWHDWRDKKVNASYFFLVCSPILGFAAYFLIMYLSTGNLFAGFEAQGSYVAQVSIGKILNPLTLIKNFFSIQYGHTFMSSPIDRLWFVMVVLGLIYMFKHDKIGFVYVLPAALVPALTTSFMSYTRYVAPLFPLFTAYGGFLANPRRRFIFWGMVGVMAVVQVFFLIRQINYYWVG